MAGLWLLSRLRCRMRAFVRESIHPNSSEQTSAFAKLESVRRFLAVP